MTQAKVLQKLRQRIEQTMHSEPGAAEGSWAAMLSALSKLYGVALTKRDAMFRQGKWPATKLACAVVSIGNITVGGTGKTPMTAFVARIALSLGYSVAILSRGYRGRAEKSGGIVSDGERLLLGPQQAGDEPFMLAQQLPGVPVAVGRDRVRSGSMLWQRYRPNLIVLDDGFQHRKLHRDLDLVLLNYQRPLGNGFLLPRGVLRELPTALGRADAVILTRSPTESAIRPELGEL